MELSTDDGATWQSIEVNPTLATNTTTIITQNINFDVTVPEPTRVLRFHWTAPIATGGPQFSSGYGWMVDDINISRCRCQQHGIDRNFQGEYTKYPSAKKSASRFGVKY